MQCAGQTVTVEVTANWQQLELGVIQQRAAGGLFSWEHKCVCQSIQQCSGSECCSVNSNMCTRVNTWHTCAECENTKRNITRGDLINRSLYVPHSAHYLHRQFNFHNSTLCPHSVFMCLVWISEQTAIISLYNIN